MNNPVIENLVDHIASRFEYLIRTESDVDFITVCHLQVVRADFQDAFGVRDISRRPGFCIFEFLPGILIIVKQEYYFLNNTLYA